MTKATLAITIAGTVLAASLGTALYVTSQKTPAPPANAVNANTSGQTQARVCTSADERPDRLCTPGAVRTTDLNVICHEPTSKYRPTLEQSREFKREALKMYGLEKAKWSDYQLDALIPLEAGGDHFDIKNMWPQPISEAHRKDKAENLGHKLICSGKRTPAEIQLLFMTDWRLIK